jgi:hypothetical protein
LAHGTDPENSRDNLARPASPIGQGAPVFLSVRN